MPGTSRSVLRIVSAAAALVVLVSAGCGGTARPDRSAGRELPRALASRWAQEASTVADVAASGDSCQAQELAATLRDEVIHEDSKVPSRLRSQLLAGVYALADRIVCQPQTVTIPEKKPPKPRDRHHDDHKHKPPHHDKQDGQG